MAKIKELSDAVDKIFSGIGATGTLHLNSATRERAFEAYVFSLLVKAVIQATGSVIVKGIKTGANPDPIIFRGAPGFMSSKNQDFSYAECSLNGEVFEVHVGVQYVGTSRALHEVDVSIYSHTGAEQVRIGGGLPGTRKLYAAIECKCYDSALGVSLGRTFVGLVSDMGGLKIKAFVTNGRGTGLADYFSKSDRPHPIFSLSPLRPKVADRFVSHVEQKLRRWCGVS